MPLFNSSLDDEPLIDGTAPIAGIDNSQPPSAIGPTLATDAVNRLTSMDGLNRPRPGVIRLQQPAVSIDSVHHVGDGQFLLNDGPAWFLYDSRSNVINPAPGVPITHPGYKFIRPYRIRRFISRLAAAPGPVILSTDTLWLTVFTLLFYPIHTRSRFTRFGLFSG